MKSLGTPPEISISWYSTHSTPSLSLSIATMIQPFFDFFILFQKPSQTGWCVHNFEPYPIVQNTPDSMPQWPDPLTAMPDNQLCISDLGSETIQVQAVQVFNPSNFIPSQNIFRLELQGSTRKTCGQRASKWAKAKGQRIGKG